MLEPTLKPIALKCLYVHADKAGGTVKHRQGREWQSKDFCLSGGLTLERQSVCPQTMSAKEDKKGTE